jgi:hypothetical protein
LGAGGATGISARTGCVIGAGAAIAGATKAGAACAKIGMGAAGIAVAAGASGMAVIAGAA